MIDGGFTRSTHVPVLFEAAEEGDDIAKQILNEWAEDVAEGIAQIQVMYDPGLILIGGGISEQGDNLIKYIEPKVAHYLPKTMFMHQYKRLRVKMMQHYMAVCNDG